MSQAVNWTGKVSSSNGVWARSGPGTNYGGLQVIAPNTVLTVTQIDGSWCLNQYGWSCFSDSNGTQLISFTDNDSSTSTISQAQNEINVANAQTEQITATDGTEETNYAYYTSTLTTYSPTFDAQSDAFIKSTRGVHGMPYQFMSSVDARPDGSSFGRMFSDKILTRMPLFLVTPGKPKFLNGFNVKQKGDIIKYLSQKDDTAISNLLTRDGRYYDLEFNYADYYDYVNPMCQMIASLLTLDGSYSIDGVVPSKYRWENWANSSFKQFISADDCVAFYIDSENQVTESFSNTTGESQLASKVNSLSDMGREIQFLLGEGAGVTFDKLAQDNYDATLQDFQDFSSKYLSFAPSSLMTKLTSGFLTVVEGGKMIFPEIWNDSQFSKSYSINIKLTTPDVDVFSWYMNIAVPLIHLIALVAPQQMGPNSYKSPFLIRAFYKGFFNIDMGIITDMNIVKGAENKWNLNGLPTEVDVSFTIKDLYDVMTITRQKDIVQLMNNVALMDYLANMCGININKPDVLRELEIYKQQILNSQGLHGRFGRTEVSLKNALDNVLNNLYRGVFR